MTRIKREPRFPMAERDLIQNRQKTVRVELLPLQLFLGKVKRELKVERQGVGVRLIGDVEMTKLNESYRKKKGTTDVLSFPYVETAHPSRQRKKADGGAYLGDIAISPKAARRNARALKRSLPDELRVLILHGVLHLLGYDHETDRGEMDRKEQKLRRRLGLS